MDPDAGISTNVGLLNLPSIPKAQQRLAEQMAALRQKVGEQFAGLDAQLGMLTTQQEQQRQNLLEAIKFQAELHTGQPREAQARMDTDQPGYSRRPDASPLGG